MKEKPTVFISHSSDDKDFVRRLANALQDRGVTPWVDEAEIRPGDDIIHGIEGGLKRATHVIVVFSPDSLLSGWVTEEMHASQFRAVNDGLRLIPVLVGDIDPRDLPPLWHSHMYSDFRDPQCFDHAIQLLLTAFDKSLPIPVGTKISIPKIEDMTVLDGRKADEIALEVLLNNPRAQEVFIRRAIVGYAEHMRSWPSAGPPPVYTYGIELSLNVTPGEERAQIHGQASLPGDDWTRPAQGVIALSQRNNRSLEMSWPFYLTLPPKHRQLVRFVFSAPRTPSRSFQQQTPDYHPCSNLPDHMPTFGSKERRCKGSTYILFSIDSQLPIGASIASNILLTFIETKLDLSIPSEPSIDDYAYKGRHG